MEFTIPIGELRCPVCKRGPEIGEEFTLIVKAGSAWKDGRAILKDGAELYRVAGYCPDHVPEEAPA